MRHTTHSPAPSPGLAVALVVLMLGVAAHADQTSTIDGQFGARAQGAIAINQAAGAGNAQANLALIAPGGDAAAAIVQSADGAAPGAMRATIGGQAFGGVRGLVSVNQAAGSGNTQFNVALIGARTHVETATDSLLAATVSRQAPTDGSSPTASRVALIDPTAFRGASGVVQVNQSAGNGNATGNAFSLQTPVLSSSH